jgi:uncharacterized protein YdeI (YjbR/CyaY-like superfamily)
LKKAAGLIRCKTMPVEPIYFADAAALKYWLSKYAAEATELVIGFMKTSSGVPGITWPQAVDEALCVGWIDGVRHRIDDQRYKMRFAPRKTRSNWSLVNIRRVAALQAEGRMLPAGMAAFEKRTEARSGTASYEQTKTPELDAGEIRLFKHRPVAWAYFESLPPGYRKKPSDWWLKSGVHRPGRSASLHSSLPVPWENAFSSRSTRERHKN